MNISHYYRKSNKKSSPVFTGHRLNIVLFAVAVTVLIILAAYQIFRKANESKRVNIGISPQCIDLFGGGTIEALIQEFEEQRPDLHIMTVQENADIIFFDDSEFGSLINDSALASLAPYIHPETQTGQWALPLVSFMDIFMYNVDILEAANRDRPPRTRAEFLAAAQAVKKAKPNQEDGQAYAFALGLSPADPMALRREFYPWLWAGGADIPLIDTANKNTPPSEEAALPRAFTDTVAFFAQLHNEGLLAPNTFEKTRAQRLQEFAAGNIAMLSASMRDITFVRHNADGITFGITAMPAATLGKTRLGLSGIYAGISSACALPDEAWHFLAFIAGKKHILAEALGAVPGAVHDSANESFPGTYPGGYIVQDPLYSKAWNIFEAADIAEYYPGKQNEDEINNLIRVKLAEALNKKEE